MRKNTFPVIQDYLIFISCHSSQQKCPKWAFSKFASREGILPFFPRLLMTLFWIHRHDSPATGCKGGRSSRTAELFVFSTHFLSPDDTCGHQRRFTWQLSATMKVWHACTQSLPHHTVNHPRQANQPANWGSQANWGNGPNASLSFLSILVLRECVHRLTEECTRGNIKDKLPNHNLKREKSLKLF